MAVLADMQTGTEGVVAAPSVEVVADFCCLLFLNFLLLLLHLGALWKGTGLGEVADPVTPVAALDVISQLAGVEHQRIALEVKAVEG